MARQIATILSIKDRMSRTLKKTTDNTKKLQRQIKHSENQVKRFSKNSRRHLDNLAKSTARVTTAFAGIAAGLTAKVSIGEAMNLEGFRTQLETATKSAQKAGQVMAWSVKLANKTPFETGSVVEMAAKFEAMGMSAKRWGEITADMAGATNKDIIQATEALVDAQVGEFERLKEFGIRKDQLMLKAQEKYGKNVVFNARGQVIDQIKLQEILIAEMSERFKGGALKQSKTLKGMWSTVMGVTKTSLAKIVGMNNDGTIKQGSLYERLKKKIQSVADTLQRWQEDGTIEEIREQTQRAFTTMATNISIAVTWIRNFIKWGIKHKKLIKAIGVAIATYFAVGKIMAIVKAIKTMVIIFRTLGALKTFSTLLNPWGLLIAAIVAGVYLIYKHWNSIKEFFIKLFKGIYEKWNKFWNGLREGIIGFANFFIKIFNRIIESINRIKVKIPDWVPKFGGKKFGLNIKTINTFANGGIANQPSIFGEAGPEIAIPLKRNNPRSQKLLNQADKIINHKESGGINIQLIVQGNMIGNEKYAEYLATLIAHKIGLIRANMA